ncbi:Multiple inositol polyphosphate phosphatase 1 [Pseudolycoriella hygida]|uniref:Multiple inositol polyphosphate phosphatase 1 n=1 Tax=Pseudolycoriella hygida TaxID=35572 RepID=A0A9Q0S5A9_9DIPT|nr:Multiple inositol polyphosphate phosphatase 1 [Pseudolycoriella hygida]
MKTVATLVVLSIVGSANAGVSINNPFYCYSTDLIRPQVQMHATRTSYEAVRRTSVNPTVSSCTPSRFWFLSRHGGRFPHPPDLQDMFDFADSTIQEDIARNYDAGRTTLCRQDFEMIRDWRRDPNLTLESASLTTEAGRIGMRNIARRYQQFFPTILTETYDRQRFHFRHTRTMRTNTTIRAFASGLFGESESENVFFEDVPENDSFLRPIDFCPPFREEVANQHQQVAFENGPEFEEMMEEINRKLGFHGSNQLSVDTVLVMWEWCRFETATYFELSESEIGDPSAWCIPFSISHQSILEYYQDLGYYHFTGYGVRNQRLIQNLNCGLMQDLLTHLQSNSSADTTVRVFVTYSQMVQALMVTLGAFRDDINLNQHNFAQQTARHWKTSIMTPNAANFVVVRYDCADGDHDLVFLLNERPILVPGCDIQTGICKLSFILSRFQRFIGVNCEDLFCSSD